MSALALYADFLKDNPETHAELAPKIAKATAAVSHLFDSLFDLSILDSGKVHLSIEPVQIADVVRDLQLQYEPLADAKNIRLRVRTGQATIHSDPVRLRRMVGNVLSNAIKYTPDGGAIRVTGSRDGDQVSIAVHDTGVGIAQTDQARVFEEFRQVGRHYTNKNEGTGLGLALTKRFVELHGGRLWLASEPGKGSTFTFTIPSGK